MEALLGGLIGQTLIQVCIGVSDVQLHFDGEYSVQLEAPVSIGEHPPVGPAKAATSLIPLLDQAVAEALVDDSGALVLTFNGVTVRCEPDVRYEAWNATGSGGERIVCAPNGELVVWPASAE